MKVLFLSQIVPYPPHGGVLQRGYNLLRELASRASVHLLAFVHPDVLPTATMVEESRRALGTFCETVEYFPLWAKASPVHRVAALAASACSSKPFGVIAHRSAALQRSLDEALGTGVFDLVHVDTIALSPFVGPGRKLPAVLTHHNIESSLMEGRSRVDGRLLAQQFLQREGAKLAVFESVASRWFDVNIVMSAIDERMLVGRVPGLRTAVVPNGVDVEYFTPDWERETPALVYAGGMNMFANRDAVMYFVREIWPRINARAGGVRVFLVGQDPPKELLKVAAQDPRLIVTGYVTDIRRVVCSSAVYVVPLRVGGGTRLKVLDAMAMGKAVVSTSIGCEGIEVRSGEHLVVADTPEGFAEATVELLRNPSRRLMIGRAARELVERRYAWPIVADQLVETYRSAIANKKTRPKGACADRLEA